MKKTIFYSETIKRTYEKKKKTEDDTKTFHAHGWEDQILLNVYTT